MKQREWVGTGEAARLLMMNKNALRATLYGTGAVCGIVPEKDEDGFHLKWPRLELIRASIQRQADCAVMLRTLEGVADWLAEQRIQTEDERVEMLYHVIQELEGRY